LVATEGRLARRIPSDQHGAFAACPVRYPVSSFMIVPTPLLSGHLVARYKRFLMDVRVGKQVIVVH
jgi:hypothetical protein